MNDNDIIKALECCTVGTFACGKECPYYSSKSNLKVSSCRFELMCEIFNLINRQKAEIERLQNTLDDVLDREPVLVERSEKYAKSEAIKEFAERLKEEATVDDDSTWWVANIDIDNLVEEMTEGKE